MRKYSRNKEHESSAAQPLHLSHPISNAFSSITKQTFTNSIFISYKTVTLFCPNLQVFEEWRDIKFDKIAISF